MGSMKNPLYWAVLIGMTILLMEQALCDFALCAEIGKAVERIIIRLPPLLELCSRLKGTLREHRHLTSGAS